MAAPFLEAHRAVSGVANRGASRDGNRVVSAVAHRVTNRIANHVAGRIANRVAVGVTSGVVTDLLARAVVIMMFSLMSANLFGDFIRTGHVTGLLLLASESLVVVLTMIRRRTDLVDRSAAGVITTALSLAGPPLLRAFNESNLVPEVVTVLASAAGLGLVIVGKLTLGRSFGIAPATRGVVIGGPYILVRHPIYAGYLLTHA